jgi:arylsulfatase A-like enzyme
MVTSGSGQGTSAKRQVILLAVWFGLVAGLLEVAVLAWQHTNRPIAELSRDYVWMTPVAVTAMCLGAGLLGLAIAAVTRRLSATRCALFLVASTASLELLLLVPRVHQAAAALLALGIGYQVMRALSRHAMGFRTVARRSLVLLVALPLIFGIWVRAGRALAERRAIADLGAAHPDAANVVLITLDTARARNMSLYGYERPTTPELEGMGVAGVVFEQALSTSSWTLPAHASLFTGRWHHEISADYEVPLDDRFPTLAERLQSRGYLTAGFVANLRYCGYETGLDRGFIHYEDYKPTLGQFALSATILESIVTNFRLRSLLRNDQHPNRKVADDLNDAVIEWLRRPRDRPYFLFLNYFDTHEPYLPPEPFDRHFGPGRERGRYSPLHRWLYDPAAGHSNMGEREIKEEIDAYDGALAYLDDRIGRLMAELRRLDPDRETLIVITSDHGEEFGEHGVFEHGYSLYRPGVRVPLLISFGDRIPHGLRIGAPVSIRDVPATIMDLLGLDGVRDLGGQSLRRHWSSDGEEPLGAVTLDDSSSPIFSQVNGVTGQPDWFPVSKGDMKSVVYRGMRYIRNGDGTEELYEYREDANETRDLAGEPRYQSVLDVARTLLPREGGR